MSKRLDLFLHQRETILGRQSPEEGYQQQTLPAEARAFAKALARGKTEMKLAGQDIDIYIAEDLLYFTRISLPRQTPDLKKAIALQLDMLSPFGEDSLSAFTARRDKEGYSVNLYFGRRSQISPFLEILFKAGAHLTGLFPESQRYLTAENRKIAWVLISPGRFSKITRFEQGRVTGRDLCPRQINTSLPPDHPEMPPLPVYSLAEVASGQSAAASLLSRPAAAREYDMLPASFRRPDYMKMATMGLIAVNLLLLILLGGGKILDLSRQAGHLDQQIETTRKDAETALAAKNRSQQLKKKLDAYSAMGSNSDLIAFMARLGEGLPDSAYLDQLRFDQTTGIAIIQGYTSDLPELTATIPNLDSATLKSTLKRRNQTFFHLEVNLQ